MPAFAAERDKAFGTRNQRRHPEAGARPQQPHHRMRLRLPVPQLVTGQRPRHGERHRQRSEIIHHQQGLQAQRAAQLFGGKLPVAVGQRHQIALNRIGQRQRRMHGLHALLLQIAVQQMLHAGELVTTPFLHILPAAGGVLQRQPRMGCADIG